LIVLPKRALQNPFRLLHLKMSTAPQKMTNQRKDPKNKSPHPTRKQRKVHQNQKRNKSRRNQKSKPKKKIEFEVSKIPLLTDEQISAHIQDKESFKNGVDYYVRSKVEALTPIEKTLTLEATCCGSGKGKYKLELTFAKEDSTHWTGKCTCPVGDLAKCKHAVAVLFEFHEQQEFARTNKSDLALKKEAGDDESKLLSDADREKYEKFLDDLNPLKVADLKELLKKNDLVVSGRKDLLMERCALAMVKGALPRCPQCAGGRLKYCGGTYNCPGFHDDDTFQECDYVTTSVARVPWEGKIEEQK